MTDIELNPQGEVVLNVDKSIYNESTIDKVLYWWAGASTLSAVSSATA